MASYIERRKKSRSIGSDQKEKKGRPRRASGDSFPQQFYEGRGITISGQTGEKNPSAQYT
jgi:hypothetical protein